MSVSRTGHTATPQSLPTTYEIDANDLIVSVGGGWLAFATDNGVDHLVPQVVQGTSIWDWIEGDSVKQIYQELFEKVRRERKTIAFPFRCDSPTLRRYMEFRVAPLPSRGLRFEVILARSEPREGVDLLEVNVDQGKLVVTCSWCQRVQVRPDEWVDVEAAISRLHLFDSSEPGLTHSICSSCEATLLT